MALPGRIAIVGMAGRFPGAGSIDSLWSLLRNGRSGITRFSRAELRAHGTPDDVLDDPLFVPYRGVIGDETFFDPAFFGFGSAEAELMDPQARLFLEVVWEAIEDAGYGNPEGRPSVGIFASVSRSEYEHHLIRTLDRQSSWAPFVLDGTLTDFVPLRAAHKFDLKGPCLLLKSACSSSLAAVHVACQSLLAGEASMAIAAAAAVSWPPVAGRLALPGSVYSKDGVCRSFDIAADGMVSSDAVAAIVLKPLDDALKDHDHVYAVIRGTAANNDGTLRASFAAPSVEGQSEVIKRALAVAGVDPGEVGYIEAHGSGTRIGDPIEIQAFHDAFGGRPRSDKPISVGSAKSNLGHPDTAAGLVGLIKATLCLHNRELVPNANFTQANPLLALQETNFQISVGRAPWLERRIACVHSIGMGGTNVHCVLEGAPLRAISQRTTYAPQLLLLSAKDPIALEGMTEALSECLEQDLGLQDAAWTLQVGRSWFSHRRAVVAASTEEAAEKLRSGKEVVTNPASTADRPVAFLCPGLGLREPRQIRELYESIPEFRAAFDANLAGLSAECAQEISELLRQSEHTPDDQDGLSWLEDDLDRAVIKTRVAHPLMFCTQLALYDLWSPLVPQPDALLGYSLGEYVAATISGVFFRKDALGLIEARARIVERQPGGRMLAVATEKTACERLLTAGMHIAAEIDPNLTVIGGSRPAAEAQVQCLKREGVPFRILNVAHPFHTPLLKGLTQELQKLIAAVPRAEPVVPFISNISGDWITADQATSAEYWASHLSSPVRLVDGMSRILSEPTRGLVELSPSPQLSDVARLTEGPSDRPIMCSLGEGNGDASGRWLHAVGAMWCSGANLAWHRLPRFKASRVRLPTYPFQRARYEAGRHAARPVERPLLKETRTSNGATTNGISEGLREAWTRAFRRAPGAESDNFFHVGGHSLLAIQLLYYVRANLGVNVTVAELRANPSIAALRQLLEARGEKGRTATKKGSLMERMAPLSKAERGEAITQYVAGLVNQIFPAVTDGRFSESLFSNAIPDLVQALSYDLGAPVYPHELQMVSTTEGLCSFVHSVIATSEVTSRTDRTNTVPQTSDNRSRPTPKKRRLSFTSRNPPAALILSSARSGSTLLRVMLAGHSALFCPPELHLLGHETLQERQDALRSQHFGRGLQRALMHLRSISMAAAEAEIDGLVKSGATVQDVYALLQRLAWPRLLVDKSPDYSGDINTLRQTEAVFSSTHFIVLLRSPFAVIESYVRNRIAAIARDNWSDPYKQAEEHWYRSYSNIARFLREGPRPACFIRYEDLVAEPSATMRNVCGSLGLKYEESLIRPYDGERMIDGAGDPNFHSHDGIDVRLAESWRARAPSIVLSKDTINLARSLGYSADIIRGYSSAS